MKKIPPFFLLKYNAIKNNLLTIRKKTWVKKIVKLKILIYIPILISNYLLYVERQKKEDAQMIAYFYQSQAKSKARTFDDLKIAYSEKLKRGDKLIMLGTNMDYDIQFLNKLGYSGIDYLGKHDNAVHDSITEMNYNRNDFYIAHVLGRKWFKEEFVLKNDTQKLAVFKFGRVDLNTDTIIGGFVFDLNKLKKELNLK